MLVRESTPPGSSLNTTTTHTHTHRHRKTLVLTRLSNKLMEGHFAHLILPISLRQSTPVSVKMWHQNSTISLITHRLRRTQSGEGGESCFLSLWLFMLKINSVYLKLGPCTKCISLNDDKKVLCNTFGHQLISTRAGERNSSLIKRISSSPTII